MYWVWQGASLLLVAILQSTLANYVGAFGIKPDFILIAVVCFGLSKGSFEGEILGFFGGLLQDLLSGGPLGINALTKTIVGFLSGIIKRSLYLENIISQAVIFAGATLIDGSLISLIKLIIYTRFQIDIRIFPLETLYNTLLGILILQVLARIRRQMTDDR